MKYKSTRGGVHGLSFEDALYTGYASDGGILIPESIPVISKETLKSWVPLSYKELAKKIVLQTEQFTNYSLIQNNSVNLSILIELFPTQNNSQNCLSYKTIHIFFSFPLSYLPYKTILNFPPILTELFPIQNNSQILSFQLVIS
jgi:hypothetical protein